MREGGEAEKGKGSLVLVLQRLIGTHTHRQAHTRTHSSSDLIRCSICAWLSKQPESRQHKVPSDAADSRALAKKVKLFRWLRSLCLSLFN